MTRTRLQRSFRASGAEWPGGDLVGARGVSMDGWFWRVSQGEQVAFALCGVNTPRRGEPWALLGFGTEPGQRWSTVDAQGAVHASEHGLALHVRDAGVDFRANRDRVRMVIGDDEIDLTLTSRLEWRGRLGGSSIFQVVPRLNQYWHPWLLGGRASGTVRQHGVTTTFTDAEVYAEKNWGRGGFPVSWWWGQAQGFGDDACLAFAGGQIHLGRPGTRTPLTTAVTALVVRLPDGRQVRWGDPVVSPVRAEVGGGHWRLSGRKRGWRVEVETCFDPADAFVLPVPLVEQRHGAPGALEAQRRPLTVRVWRHGREVWSGRTGLAALERGGRATAEAEAARRPAT